MGSDYTDQVLAEWHTVRPEFDVSTAGVVNRVLRLARLLESELDRVVTRHGLSTKGDFDTLASEVAASDPPAVEDPDGI